MLVVQHADDPRFVQTLAALIAGTRKPDRLVVVDATAGRDVPERLAAQSGLSDAYPTLSVVTVPPCTSFADIVDTAVNALPDPGEDVVVALRPRERARRRPVRPRDRTQWLWLLHEDSAPDPDALERLVLTVGTSDRIGVAGCKVVRSAEPRRLVNVGLDLTRTGRHVGERMADEADQGQYDDRRDALGVSSAGLLIRRDVYLQLGGFDPAFDGAGDGLDLSWRTHLIGRQVVVVPEARVHQDLRADTRDLDHPAPGSTVTLRRHRQVALARCSLPMLVPMALWILVGGLLMSLLLLLAKRPRSAWRELAQATAPFGLTRIIGARWRFIGRATTRRRNLRGMFVPWTGAVEHALDTVGDAVVPTAWESEDDGDTGTRTRGRNPLTNPGLLLTVLLVVVSGIWWRDLIHSGALRGTGTGLTGGALQPFATDAEGIWRMWRDAWTGTGLGSAGTSVPYLVVLAPLAWLVQWIPGVNDAASGAAVVAWLLVLAMPLSGLAAYFAGRIATHARWPRAAAGLAWATLPTLTTAVTGGRLGPVVAHIVLPFAFAGVFAIGRRSATVTITAATAVAATLVGAFSPPLLIALSVVAVLVAVVRRGWARVRGIAVAVLPWVLLGPWTVDLRDDWRAALTGPGGLTDTDHAQPWQVALLHPGGAGSYLVWLSAPVLVVGLLGLLLPGRALARAGLAAVGLAGLAAALAAPHLHLIRWSDGVRTPWAGSGVELYAAALLGAALLAAPAAGIASRARLRHLAQRSALVVTAVATAFFAVLAGMIAWTDRPTDTLSAAPAVTTPLVQSQLTGRSAARVLRLTVDRSGAVTYTLQGRETGVPAAGLRQPSVSGGTPTAAAVAGLVSGSSAAGGSDVTTRLRDLAVTFVVVDGPGNPARVEQALRNTTGLASVAATPEDSGASIWRVTATTYADRSVPGSRVRVFTAGTPSSALPSRPAHSRSTITLAAGSEDRAVVISEGAGWRTHGQVSFNGRVVPATAVGAGTISYAIPGAEGTVRIDPGLAHARWQLAQGVLAAALVYLAVPFGNRRSRQRR